MFDPMTTSLLAIIYALGMLLTFDTCLKFFSSIVPCVEKFFGILIVMIFWFIFMPVHLLMQHALERSRSIAFSHMIDKALEEAVARMKKDDES